MDADTATKHPVTIRPPADLHTRLADAASWVGVSLNNFILQAAAERADAVLERRQSIHLTSEDARMILAQLDSDQEPNEALQKAFKNRQRLFHVQD